MAMPAHFHPAVRFLADASRNADLLEKFNLLMVPMEDGAIEAAGFIPTFLDSDDERPAREQIDANYQHGGGWQPFKGHTFNPNNLTLQYPDDPPLTPFLLIRVKAETVLIYPYAWTVILQDDGTWECARID